MAVTTQLSVFLENKPGQLAKLARALAKAKVNIRAISVADTAESCVVRLVVDAARKAQDALRRGKFASTTSRVVAIKAEDAPGKLASVAGTLSKAKINIDYVYGSGGAGVDALLVIAADDPAKAEKALK